MQFKILNIVYKNTVTAKNGMSECVGLDFNKLMGEDFPEKVPLTLRKDWKLAMQTVGGGAFHREKPTCRRVLGKERKQSTRLQCGGQR